MKAGRFVFVWLALALVAATLCAGEPAGDAAAATEVITNREALEWLPTWLHSLATYDIFGYHVWRLVVAFLIAVAAMALNTVIAYYIRKISDRKDEAKKEKLKTEAVEPGAAEEVESPEKKSFIGMTIRALRRPLWVLVWAVAIRLIGPVLLPAHAPGAIWLAELLMSLSLAVFIYDFVEVIEYYLMQYAATTETKLDDMLVPILRKALRVLVVVIAGLHIYQSFSGQPITTILAGLGLGGLAFALAAQDTLKNFFGFIMIVLDKPFQIGERIVFEGHDGVVEEVGLRSTKLRRLDGHVVSIPNMSAADSVIHNIGRRPYIRRLMDIGVTYDTPAEKVERAVQIVKEVLDNHEGMDPEFPPRVYFNNFNDCSLNIFVIYWYHPPEYWDYMAHAEWVNFEILKRFNAEGIEFAFPTQTLFLAGDPNRELLLKHTGHGGFDDRERPGPRLV